jgi:pyridoxal phosphate enzyme (YggS family)
MSEANLQERLAAIRERIAAAAKRAGRAADEITLIAVSKTHSAAAIRAAFEQGIEHFGENRVQEWEGKRDALQDLQAEWHLVGHLQSNKAAKAARYFHSIDSVDDFVLAQRLDRARAEFGESRKLRVLIEVRIAPEESKSGVARDLLIPLAEQISALSGLDLQGLMCIPPFVQDLEKVRRYFTELRMLKEDLERRLGKNLAVLSMGMSHDFAVAIEEGATEVRVGTALFGARPLPPGQTGQARVAI